MRIDKARSLATVCCMREYLETKDFVKILDALAEDNPEPRLTSEEVNEQCIKFMGMDIRTLRKVVNFAKQRGWEKENPEPECETCKPGRAIKHEAKTPPTHCPDCKKPLNRPLDAITCPSCGSKRRPVKGEWVSVEVTGDHENHILVRATENEEVGIRDGFYKFPEDL